jgi:hypothetical protein
MKYSRGGRSQRLVEDISGKSQLPPRFQTPSQGKGDEANSALYLKKKIGTETDLRSKGEEQTNKSETLNFADRMRLAQQELEMQEAKETVGQSGPKPPLYLRKKGSMDKGAPKNNGAKLELDSYVSEK